MNKRLQKHVFKASSNVATNPSLNDCLYSGPCLLPLFFKILLCCGEMTVVADIKRAFLNIEINVSHRDFFDILAGGGPFRKTKNGWRGILRQNERLCTAWAPKLGLVKKKSITYALFVIFYHLISC